MTPVLYDDLMNIVEAIASLETIVKNPSEGLPQELFYYISRTTPIINVDLLIKDEEKRTLLAWRDDEYAGSGWHIPGGVVRFKERLEERVVKVAETEVGATIEYESEPIALNQIIVSDRDTRGHFISLLYNCKLSRDFAPHNRKLNPTDSGYLKWHQCCPSNLLSWHEIYRSVI